MFTKKNLGCSMKKNKVLLMSLESLNKESSNSQMLLSLLSLINGCDLTQIYFKGREPNAFAGDYFLISEKVMLKSIFKRLFNFKVTKITDLDNSNNNNVKSSPKTSIKKTSITALLRNLLWKLSINKIVRFFRKIPEFKFDYIVFFENDIPAFSDLVIKLSSLTNSKIIYVTSEDYCLKKHNYLGKKISSSLFYNIYHNFLYKSRKEFLKVADLSVFLTSDLMKYYAINGLSTPNSTCLMPISSINKIEQNFNNDTFVISYCGSLGVGRLDTLFEIIASLEEIPDLKFIVASNLKQDDIIKIKSFKNVEYRGFVSKSEVLNIYSMSNLLLHVESFDSFFAVDCKFAFSGKISDCLFSQIPFAYIGPKTNTISKFIEDENCAFSFHSIDDFKEFINHARIKGVVLKNNSKKLLEIQKKYFDRTYLINYFNKEADDGELYD